MFSGAPGRPCRLSAGIVTDRTARTITFHLTAPDPDFLAKLAMPVAYAVPPGTTAGSVTATATLLGSAPYMAPEVALGRQFGKLVVGLEGAARVDGVEHAATAQEAVARVARHVLRVD